MNFLGGAELKADCRKEIVVGVDHLLARVDEHRKIFLHMALDLASFQAHLPDQSAVVVSNDAGDRHAFENSRAWNLHVAVDLRAASNLWQNLHRNVEELAQSFVPRQGLEIHQHRSRCVCDVCGVDARVDAA